MRGGGIPACMEGVWNIHQDEDFGKIWVFCQCGHLRGNFLSFPSMGGWLGFWLDLGCWGGFEVFIVMRGVRMIWYFNIH